MNERAIGLLKEIEKNASIILQDWRLKFNPYLPIMLALKNILTLSEMVIREIEKSPETPGEQGIGR